MNTSRKLLFSLAYLLSAYPAWIRADPLDTWTWRNPVTGPDSLQGVIYGSTQFVAVGSEGRILTSPDGVDWTSRDSGFPNSALYDIIYGNGQFAAVGSNWDTNYYGGSHGVILTSPDGVAWTSRPVEATNVFGLSCIAFGNDMFVAGGVGPTQLLTSSDGVTWTSRDSGLTNAFLNSITYGNHLFLALGTAWTNGTNVGVVVTSPDGINWTSRTSVIPYDYNDRVYGAKDIAYGNNQFVVARSQSGTLLTSSDGLTWSNVSASSNTTLVTFGGNEFLVLGSDTNGNSIVLTSPNGVTWTNHDSAGSGFDPAAAAAAAGRPSAIAYGSNRFLGVGNFGGVWDSPDGLYWTNRTAVTRNGLRAAVHGGDQFVAVGGATILTSPDGNRWNLRDPATTNTLFGVAYGNNRFVAVGWGPTIVTSPDGVIWTNSGSGFIQGELIGVTYASNLFVAVGADLSSYPATGTILTSPDGIAWTNRALGFGSRLYGIAYGKNQFVAVGSDSANAGAILTSPDGADWTYLNPGVNARLVTIAYGNGEFVAVGIGSGPLTLTSLDGINWVSHSTSLPVALGDTTGLAFGHNQFVAVTDSFYTGSRILTSCDGVAWIERQSSSAYDLYGVGYGSNSFVAVGETGAILQSGVLPPVRPVLGPVMLLPTGAAQVTLSGEVGQTYSIEASPDLTTWSQIGDITLTNETGQFGDPAAVAQPRRFYRVRQH